MNGQRLAAFFAGVPAYVGNIEFSLREEYAIKHKYNKRNKHADKTH